jgi:hypothetical protein
LNCNADCQRREEVDEEAEISARLLGNGRWRISRKVDRKEKEEKRGLDKYLRA